MRTTARILASLGTGILVLGLAAFRSPQTAPAVQAAGLSEAQTVTWTPSGQAAVAPWSGTSSLSAIADHDDHHDRDRDRDRSRDRRRRNNGWFQNYRGRDNRYRRDDHDRGRHRGWWKKDDRRRRNRDDRRDHDRHHDDD